MMDLSIRNVTSPKGEVTLFKITNKTGACVELSSLGAGITKIIVPDKEGRLDDVVLGYASESDYLYDGACAGKTPGRFANRIARGLLTIDGNVSRLAINNPPNALHGGPEGFHNQLWKPAVIPDGVRFTYHARHGEEGYPGNMTIIVEYTWNELNELKMEYWATTDRPTAVNLTNHAYFNLSGHDSGSCLGMTLQMNCPKWLPVDDTDIPTGEIGLVAGTPMDFLTPKPLRRDINAGFSTLIQGKGYNHYFLFDDASPTAAPRHIATLHDNRSGRTLVVGTTHPGAMLYTGNWLDGSPLNKNGRPYNDHDGVAIECQEPPDAPNQPVLNWRPLRRGDIYHHLTIYRFEVG